MLNDQKFIHGRTRISLSYFNSSYFFSVTTECAVAHTIHYASHLLLNLSDSSHRSRIVGDVLCEGTVPMSNLLDGSQDNSE